MKTFNLLIILLICCSCSGNQKDIPAKQKAEERVPETQVPEAVVKSEELTNHVTKYRILPIDQSSEDPSLKRFVSKLKGIIQRKDLNGLIQCLDTGIVVSYGGGEYGIEVFKERCGLNFEPEKAPLWKKLDQLISMGGAWNDKEKSSFCFPYAHSNLLYSQLNIDLDCYHTVTCIDPKVIVYKKPNIRSEKVGILSYEMLTTSYYSTDFTKIHTVDNTISGYTQTKQLLHCSESYPILQKLNGEWKIVSFAPYD